MNIRSLIVGFITGSITAGIVTLLTAPNSGKETMAFLKNEKDQLRNQIKDLRNNFLELKASLKTLGHEGKENIIHFIEEVKVLVQDWKQDIEPHQEKLRMELDSLQKLLEEIEKSLPQSADLEKL